MENLKEKKNPLRGLDALYVSFIHHLHDSRKTTENHIKKIIVQGFKYEECKYNLTFPEFLSIQNNQDVQSVDENE